MVARSRSLRRRVRTSLDEIICKNMRTIIIGTGVGIRTHLPALAGKVNDSDICLVSRNVVEARAKLDRTLGLFVSDLAYAIEKWEPELVIVGSPPWCHASHAESLKSCSARILFEKPVGVDFDQCKSISSTLSRADVFVNFQLRGLPIFGLIRNLVKDRLGHIHRMDVKEQSSAFCGSDPKDWYFDPTKGGGQRLSMATHLTDLILFLLSVDGQSDSVNVIFSDCPPPFHTFSAHYTVNGTGVEISSSSNQVGTRVLEIGVYGANGEVFFSFRNGVGRSSLHIKSSTPETVWEYDGDDKSLFRVAMPYYLDKVITSDLAMSKSQGLATLQDALITHELLTKFQTTNK